jgi:RNA polymerase sigma-70 factor (ECF subfamily)
MSKQQRFSALAKAVTPELYRYALWLTRDPAVSQDLVQEALLRGWKSLDSLRDEGSAKRWLITILRRENARRFERIRPEEVDIDALGDSDHHLAHHDEAPEIGDVRQAIDSLDVDYREPLALQVLMGFSTKEIAETMELTQGAVLTRLFRARKKVREVLERDGVEAWREA